MTSILISRQMADLQTHRHHEEFPLSLGKLSFACDFFFFLGGGGEFCILAQRYP